MRRGPENQNRGKKTNPPYNPELEEDKEEYQMLLHQAPPMIDQSVENEDIPVEAAEGQYNEEEKDLVQDDFIQQIRENYQPPGADVDGFDDGKSFFGDEEEDELRKEEEEQEHQAVYKHTNTEKVSKPKIVQEEKEVGFLSKLYRGGSKILNAIYTAVKFGTSAKSINFLDTITLNTTTLGILSILAQNEQKIEEVKKSLDTKKDNNNNKTGELAQNLKDIRQENEALNKEEVIQNNDFQNRLRSQRRADSLSR